MLKLGHKREQKEQTKNEHLSTIKELFRDNIGLGLYGAAFSDGVAFDARTEIISTAKKGFKYYSFPNTNVNNPLHYATPVSIANSMEIDTIWLLGSLGLTGYLLYHEKINNFFKNAFHREKRQEKEWEPAQIEKHFKRHRLRDISTVIASSAFVVLASKAMVGIANNLASGNGIYTITQFIGIDPVHQIGIINQLAWQDAFVAIPAATIPLMIGMRNLITYGHQSTMQQPIEHQNYRSWLVSKAASAKNYLITGLGAAQSILLMELDKVISGHWHLSSAEPLAMGVASTTAMLAGAYTLRQQIR